MRLLNPVIFSDGCIAILHRNLVDDGCVTDLVMSNAPRRFVPTLAFLEQQNQTQRGLLAQANAERAALETRLVQAQTERDAILSSSSWRLSAPLRWLKRTMTLLR